jgi:hypothetical protein
MIYFLQPQGRAFVKIGSTRHVGRRADALQTANPDELIILGVIAGGCAKETAIHSRFAHLHVRGEWFRYTREIYLFLKANAEDYQPQIHDPEANGAAGLSKWQASIAAVRPTLQERGRRIRVWVAHFLDRTSLVLQWYDPNTGKRCSKTARTSNRDEAELRRADLEAALNFSRCNGGPIAQPAELPRRPAAPTT